MWIANVQKVERYGAVVKRRIQDRELDKFAGSTPASTKCCVIEQDTLSTLLRNGFYQRKPARDT